MIHFKFCTKMEKKIEKRQIGHEAVWSLSSAKPGNGVDQLRDDNLESYWQSDGGQPHLVNIQFHKKMAISEVALYLDFKLDESYTPKKVAIYSGTNYHDLTEVQSIEINEPHGWISLNLSSLRHSENHHVENIPLRTFFLQLRITAMHQNGRDTHIRQIKVFGPRHIGVQQDLPPFNTIEMQTFACLR